MKLQIASTDGQNAVTAYGDGYVSVNAVRHTTNVIVLPRQLMPDWTVATSTTLALGDFELLATLDTEIILLGTGRELRFPPPELMRPLIFAQKGLEIMDMPAACRTFNVLISEGRKVAAALLLT